jgi:hypothetical protein
MKSEMMNVKLESQKAKLEKSFQILKISLGINFTL